MISSIDQIERDIKSVKIQGATNVALATLEGIKIAIKQTRNDSSKMIKVINEVGERLSLARENEPLARHGVKYILSNAKKLKSSDLYSKILNICDSYQVLIQNAKREIIKFGTEVLRKEKVVLTHCHSSTAVSILKNVAKYKKI